MKTYWTGKSKGSTSPAGPAKGLSEPTQNQQANELKKNRSSINRLYKKGFASWLLAGSLLTLFNCANLHAGNVKVIDDVGKESSQASDWSMGASFEIDYQLPLPPGVQLPQGSIGGFGVIGNSYYVQVNTNTTRATTDWLTPYVLNTSPFAGAHYSYDGTTGTEIIASTTAGISDSFDYQAINQHVYIYKDVTIYHDVEPSIPYYYWGIKELIRRQEVGENVFDPTIINEQLSMTAPLAVATNASSFVYVPVPAVTIAFLGTNQPTVADANYEPLASVGNNGRVYKDPNSSSSLNYAWTQIDIDVDSGGNHNTNNSPATYSVGSISPQRPIVWYGRYKDILSTNTTGNTTIVRNPIPESWLTNTSGHQIGTLVTYEVVPAYPVYSDHEGLTNLTDYAFQVAMQLGNILKYQYIYADSGATNITPTPQLSKSVTQYRSTVFP